MTNLMTLPMAENRNVNTEAMGGMSMLIKSSRPPRGSLILSKSDTAVCISESIIVLKRPPSVCDCLSIMPSNLPPSPVA